MLSARTQYACLAAAQLASEYASGQPVQAGRIAERHGIPPTFLVQILNELKRAGLVTSTRGAGGGYRLSSPPEQTTMADVVDLLEPAELPDACAAARSPLAATVHRICCELATDRRARLAEVTIADLAEGLGSETEPMWYI
ncbi:Rrf2 family transcriptional regulator [Pirellulales bacterium]|nr:Rrf2 family transcriptional regulator [Pirellulales bacterium]